MNFFVFSGSLVDALPGNKGITIEKIYRENITSRDPVSDPKGASWRQRAKEKVGQTMDTASTVQSTAVSGAT